MDPRKQSIWMIVLQIASIIIGLFTTFYVAIKLSPEVFAIVGVFSIITSVISVFSNSGLETYAGRNVLAWNLDGKTELTEEIVSQAFFTRTFMALALTLPMALYSYLMSINKFDGKYFDIFILMCFSAVIQAMNDSQCLLLKAFNRYLLASISSSVVQVFSKLVALFLFIKYGLYAYIYVLLATPLFVTIPLLFVMKRWIHIKYFFNLKDLKNNIKLNRFFTFSAYMRFGIKEMDLFLVSIFLKPEIMGTYTLVKKVESMSNGFISNLFDPILQELVKYKKDIDQWKAHLIKILNTQKIIIVIFFTGIIALLFILPSIINLLKLGKYPYLFGFLICMFFSQLIYVIYKVRYDTIIYFSTPKDTFLTALFNGIFLLLAFLLFQLFPIKFLYAFAIVGNLATYFYVLSKNPNYQTLFCNISD